jgi:hypothetical protein
MIFAYLFLAFLAGLVAALIWRKLTAPKTSDRVAKPQGGGGPGESW